MGRLAVPVLFCWCLCFLLVGRLGFKGQTGAAASSAEMAGLIGDGDASSEAALRALPAAVTRAPATALSPWQEAVRMNWQVLHDLETLPAACWTGETVSEFQMTQCDRDWKTIFQLAALVLCPWGLCLLLYGWCLDQGQAFYRKIRKKIESGEAAFSSALEQAPGQGAVGGRLDLFAWLFGLVPVLVSAGGGGEAEQEKVRVAATPRSRTQKVVYLSALEAIPQVGQVLVAFDLGVVWGQRRWVAIPYYRHSAVLKMA